MEKIPDVKYMKNGQLMTMLAAAKYLGVNPITISRYCKMGRLTYYMFGSRKRFRAEDLDKFLTIVPAQQNERNEQKEGQNDPFRIS